MNESKIKEGEKKIKYKTPQITQILIICTAVTTTTTTTLF
jgi:hypothetical protein